MDESGFTPEEIAMLMALGGYEGELGDLQSQMAAAQKLREFQPAPYTQGGRVVVANPWGALAGVVTRGQGKNQQEAAQKRIDEIRAEQARQRALFASKYSGGGTPGGNPAGGYGGGM